MQLPHKATYEWEIRDERLLAMHEALRTIGDLERQVEKGGETFRSILEKIQRWMEVLDLKYIPDDTIEDDREAETDSLAKRKIDRIVQQVIHQEIDACKKQILGFMGYLRSQITDLFTRSIGMTDKDSYSISANVSREASEEIGISISYHLPTTHADLQHILEMENHVRSQQSDSSLNNDTPSPPSPTKDMQKILSRYPALPPELLNKLLNPVSTMRRASRVISDMLREECEREGFALISTQTPQIPLEALETPYNFLLALLEEAENASLAEVPSLPSSSTLAGCLSVSNGEKTYE